jgi:hypothetical protein
MSVSIQKLRSSLFVVALLSFALWSSACQQTAVTNTNTTNVNATNTNTSNANTATTTSTGATIETREPEKYSTTITLRLETTGTQNLSLPLTGEFARNGADRRLSFTLPGSESVIYLDKPDKRYIILPKRKQYAELTPEATGFEVPSAMTPAQIVEQLKKAKGYELVGDDQLNGRPVTKYRYTGTAKTGTQAGEVKTEAFLYVDKQTGLPLRSESISESTTGNVQGITGLKLIQELNNIQTEVAPTLFEIPQGYAKIEAEQVRQQVNMVAQAVLAIVQQVMQRAGNTQSSSSNSSNANASTTPTASPAR